MSPSRLFRIVWPWAVLSAVAAGCPSSSPSTGPLCGAGTLEEDGVCVPAESGAPTCGPQTELDPETQTCVGVTACGQGTTLNRETHECEPLATCAPGTALNLQTGQCETVAACGPGTVQVGTECVTEASCGAGTVLAPSGACEAVEPCAPGTSFNSESLLCESLLTCGAGQVEIAGVCLDDVSAAADAADVQEGVPDTNDPALGGTPEPLGTATDGSVVTFAGTVDRARDLDEDGDLDQDKDLWSFEAAGGQWVTLRVQSDGLPQPAFVVRGPHGYLRESPLGYVDEAERVLLLPYDGSYTIEVLPSLHELAGVPVGSPEAGYLGTLTGISPPAPTEVALASPGVPVEVSGGLLDTSANLYRFTAVDDAPVVVQLDASAGLATSPVAVLALSEAGDVLSDTVLSPRVSLGTEVGNWAALVTVPGRATLVLLDYVRSRGPEDAYAGRLIEVPLFEGGVLPTHGFATAELDVGLGELAALRYTVDDLQVVNLALAPACSGFICPPFVPEATVVAGYAAPPLPSAAGSYQHVAHEVPHTLFFRHLLEQVAGAPEVSLRTSTPVILDAANADAPVAASGPRFDLGPSGDELWALITSEGAEALALSFSRSAGAAGADVTDSQGKLLRQVRSLRPEQPFTWLPPEDGASVVHLFNRDSFGGGAVIADWALTAEPVALPDAREVEPNDQVETATSLPPLPTSVRGWIGQLGEDVYRFQVPVDLTPHQLLRLRVDAPTALDPNGNDDQLQVLVLDEAGQIYGAIPQGTDLSNLTDTSGLRASQGEFLVPVAPGDVLHLRVRGQRRHMGAGGVRAPGEHPYVLDLSLVEGALDVEPNDDPDAAGQNNPFPGLPGTAWGWLDKATDNVDTFALSLDADLVEGESLVVEALDLETASRLSLALRDESGAVVAVQTNNARASIQAGGLVAGSYRLEVTGPSIGANQPHYRVDAWVAGRFEHEPNDAAAPDDLGLLQPGGQLVVDAVSEGEDVFLFSLAEPLADEDHVEIEVLGLGMGAPLVRNKALLPVLVYDGADPGTAVLVAGLDDVRGRTVARLTGTGPFALVQDFTNASPGRYQIWLRHVPGVRAETEPNDLAAEPLPPLPAVVLGNTLDRSGEADVDLYALSLPADLAAGAALEVSVTNTQDGDPQVVSLLDPSSTVVDTATGEHVVLRVPAASAGDWTVRVEYAPPAGFGQYRDPNTYTLSVSVVDAQ